MSDSPSPPPAPDYASAAQATSQGNLEAARASAKANRVNQVTPYGNLTYSQTGSDPDSGWTATQTLSPEQQKMLEQNNSLSTGLLGTAQSGLGKVNQLLENPTIDESKLAEMPISGQSVQDAIFTRLRPQMEHQREGLESQLANQGLARGSEAYDRAMTQEGQQENDLMTQAALQGMDTGMSARQQGIQEQAYLQDRPLNVINALRTGGQIQSPNFTNTPQQGQTAGANVLGAAQATGQAQGDIFNAQVGASNANKSTVGAGLGAAAMAAAAYF